jgi:hypothetical protein
MAASAVPQPMPTRETDRVPPIAAPGVEDDDDYGEFTIERPGSAPMQMPSARPAAAPSRGPAPAPSPGLRPSLIPGIRPGAQPQPQSQPMARQPFAPAASAEPAPGIAPRVTTRTIMGVPAMSPMPAPPPSVQARPAPAPGPAPSTPPPAVVPAPGPGARPPSGSFAPLGAAAAGAVSNVVAQKMSALAARGPEYEAIARLSREIIEQVVWEIVPELAEAIIRQEVDRLAAAKR